MPHAARPTATRPPAAAAISVRRVSAGPRPPTVAAQGASVQAPSPPPSANLAASACPSPSDSANSVPSSAYQCVDAAPSCNSPGKACPHASSRSPDRSSAPSSAGRRLSKRRLSSPSGMYATASPLPTAMLPCRTQRARPLRKGARRHPIPQRMPWGHCTPERAHPDRTRAALRQTEGAPPSFCRAGPPSAPGSAPRHVPTAIPAARPRPPRRARAAPRGRARTPLWSRTARAPPGRVASYRARRAR